MKVLSTIGAFLCATTALGQSIEIMDAYARSAGESAKAGGAFMIINNTGEEDVTLIGGQTDYAARTEIHTHAMTAEGVMKMSKVEGGLKIPAGQCVALARGGYHVMMMGLTKPMIDGDMMKLSLEFENADPVDFEVKIDSQFEEPAEPMLPEGRDNCLNAKDAMTDMDHSKMEQGEKMDHEAMKHDNMMPAAQDGEQSGN